MAWSGLEKLGWHKVYDLDLDFRRSILYDNHIYILRLILIYTGININCYLENI